MRPWLCPVICTGLIDGAWLKKVRRTSSAIPSTKPWNGDSSSDRRSFADVVAAPVNGVARALTAAAARGARRKTVGAEGISVAAAVIELGDGVAVGALIDSADPV
jgi:hypothetical protein